MAVNTTNSNNKNTAPPARVQREHKFVLSSLFTPAEVVAEPEEVLPVIAAGLREAHVKKEYPEGYLARVNAVFKGEFLSLLKSVAFFLVSTLPFIIAITVGLTYFQNYVLGGAYNFMGGIGVGYPGGGDSIIEAVSRLYWDVYEPVVCFACVAAFIASIFASGLFYCVKRSYYQDSYKKVVKTFFMGVKRYWWQYMLTIAFSALVATAMATSMLFFLSQNAGGAAGAGAYCAVVFTFIFGAPLLLVSMVMQSQFVNYNLSFGKTFKNALVIIANCPIMSIGVGLISSVPYLLMITPLAGKIIVYIIMVLCGFVYLTLALVSMGKRGMDKCKVYQSQQLKKIQVAKRAETKSTYQGNPAAAKKKAQPKPTYQNPKKKKKK